MLGLDPAPGGTRLPQGSARPALSEPGLVRAARRITAVLPGGTARATRNTRYTCISDFFTQHTGDEWNFFHSEKDKSSSSLPIAIIIIKLIKTAPYILLTHRRVKTHGRLLTGTRYCFPRRRLSPRQREAGTRAKAPGGLRGPPTRRKADTGRKGTPHTSCPFPPGDTRRRPRSPAAPAAWQGWEGAGRPAHPRSAPCPAVPCRALPCRALPCHALPPPAGRQLRKGGAECPRGRGWRAGPCGRGAQRRAGGGSHMCPTLTAAAFKDRHKSGGGRGKGRAAPGRGSRTSWRREERPPTRLQQRLYRRRAGRRQARQPEDKKAGAPKSPWPRLGTAGSSFLSSSSFSAASASLRPDSWRSPGPCGAQAGWSGPPWPSSWWGSGTRAGVASGTAWRREVGTQETASWGNTEVFQKKGVRGNEGCGSPEGREVWLSEAGMRRSKCNTCVLEAGRRPGASVGAEGMERRWEEWKAATIPVVMGHRSCSPDSCTCFCRRKVMFGFKASPKGSVLMWSLPFGQFFLCLHFSFGGKKKKGRLVLPGEEDVV